MSTTSSTECRCAHGCCETKPQPFFQSENFKKVMAVMETLSLIALAFFAAYCSPKYFFPFFGAGAALGLALYWNTEKAKDGSNESGGEGGCTQLFVERLTGVKLPPPLGLVANIAITVCHIDHHAVVFVPLIALNAGMWVGKLAGQNIPLICRRSEPEVEPEGEQV